MIPIAYHEAHQIQALGSFSFLLAGESHPVMSKITQEFYYATKKLKPSPYAVLAFQWCSDPGVIPAWRNPQTWCKFDPEHGWVVQ